MWKRNHHTAVFILRPLNKVVTFRWLPPGYYLTNELIRKVGFVLSQQRETDSQSNPIYLILFVVVVARNNGQCNWHDRRSYLNTTVGLSVGHSILASQPIYFPRKNICSGFARLWKSDRRRKKKKRGGEEDAISWWGWNRCRCCCCWPMGSFSRVNRISVKSQSATDDDEEKWASVSTKGKIFALPE